MKYEAIHSLVKWSGSNIKAIYNKAGNNLWKSEAFEKQLNIYANITKDREGKMHFSLDPKHLANFSIYFYSNLLEQSEAF